MGSQDGLSFSSGVTGTITSASTTQLTVSIVTPPTTLGELDVTVTVNGVTSAVTQVATEVNGDFVVTDPGNGSGSFTDITLPYAVATALNGDTVSFASSLSGATIYLDAAVTINSNITIAGLGANELTVSGNNSNTVFFLPQTTVEAIISGLTITQGRAQGFYGHQQWGGGVSNYGTLTLSGDNISGNYASYGGGAIYNVGEVTIYDSTLDNNVGVNYGGAVYNDQNGAIGTASIVNSTIADNRADYDGGGIYNNGSVTLANSTITGNAGYYYGTFEGGGIKNNNTLAMVDTIVSGNGYAYTYGRDIQGTVNSASYSIIGNSSSFNINSGSNNQVGVNPELASSPAYNGGPTETVALNLNSPAVLAGGPVTTVTGGLGASALLLIRRTRRSTSRMPAAIAETPGDYTITIGMEELLVTNVNVSQNTLTVERGYNDTTAGTYADGTDIQFATDQRGSTVFTPSIGAYEPGNQRSDRHRSRQWFRKCD